jgi:CelD/BcsL family acetyltransferase involved in cellulose biosynthesis
MLSMTTQAGATVTPVDPAEDPRWDEFVRAHPDARPYHLGGWARVLNAAYGFKPAYLALVAPGGELQGVLPLMRTRGLMTGRRLRSLPVVPPADPIATSDDGVRALIEAACAMTDAGAKVWTLHARRAGYEELVPELRGRARHPSWVLDLPPDIDELRRGWKKTSNNLFRNLKKADKAGVTVRVGRDESDVKAFYRLYLRTMRRLATMPRPYRQVVEDHRLLGPDGAFRLLLAEHDGDIVAGGVFHALGDTVDLLYNGSDDARLDVRPNHALYWHAIEWAAGSGHRRFDFGQGAREGSLARFKMQWGAVEVPEYRYDYIPGAAAEPPDAAHRAHLLDGAGEPGRLERAWKRAPLPLTRVAARVAYRYL